MIDALSNPDGIRHRVSTGRTIAAAAISLAVALGAASAENYPSRPVRMIVPFAPGGPADVMGRLLAQKLGDRLGKQFYIENQGGAGGNIGMGAAARATPDGYTLVVVSSSFVVNPGLYDQVPFDPVRDFAPITVAGASPNVLVVNPSVPANNLKELVALVKAKPGTFNFASAGVGTTPHLSGELLRLTQQLDLVHVPFAGSAPAVQSALAGHTPIAFAVLTPAVQLVKDGKLRALAVTTARRAAALPDVPTVAEAGFPELQSDTMIGVLAPAGTPSEIVKLLHDEIAAIMALPDVRERLPALGFAAVAGTPDEFAALIRAELPRWRKVIQDGHIKPQ